jgi:hypothetical protein
MEGSLADISGSSNSVTLNRMTQVSDAIRTFGGTDFPIRQACGRDAEITLKVIYSMSQIESKQILNDWYENHHTDRRTLQVFMPDALPGSDKYEFEVYLERLNVSVESGTPAPIMIEATLKPSGTFTWSVVAS